MFTLSLNSKHSNSLGMKFVFILFINLVTIFSHGLEIELAMNAKVKNSEDEKFIDKKSGETIELNAGNILFIVPEKQLPFILVGENPSSKKIVLNSIDLSETFAEVIDQKIQLATDVVISEMKKIEHLLKKKDYSGAQGRVSSLKHQYPKISQVLFLSATVSYLANNNTQAIEDLNRGLAIDPNDESAKQLLKKLELKRP